MRKGAAPTAFSLTRILGMHRLLLLPKIMATCQKINQLRCVFGATIGGTSLRTGQQEMPGEMRDGLDSKAKSAK